MDWVAETCELERGKLLAGLQAKVNPLLYIAGNAKAFGLELAVYQYLEPGIRTQAHALEALH